MVIAAMIITVVAIALMCYIASKVTVFDIFDDEDKKENK